MSEPSSFLDPDMVAIARRASTLGVRSDGHLADVFGMDMLEAATSPTGYTAAEAYYALDQATEPGDYMGARNVGVMALEEAAEIFGAYAEGYKEAIALSDGDTFGGIFSAGRIRRYKKQLDRYNAARDDNDQKKAARAMGRMRALWGRMSSADRKGLVSPDKVSVPGVEIAKQALPKAAAMDAKMTAKDESSTDAADAEANAEEAMGAAFGAGGVKAYKNRKAYIELILKGRADGSLSLSAIDPIFSTIKDKRGLPTPAQVMEGAPATVDMIVPAAKGSNSMMGAVSGDSNRKKYVDYIIRQRLLPLPPPTAQQELARIFKEGLSKFWSKIRNTSGLPAPDQVLRGATVTTDMAVVKPSTGSKSMMGIDDLDIFGAEDLDIFAETNAEDVMGVVFGADGVKDYRNRKAYVEAAVKAIASGQLGKVNLVRLWKNIKGRQGLPSPSEIKAGAVVTLDMVIPPAPAMVEALGADGDSDYANRKMYVQTAVRAITDGKKVNLVRLWKLVKDRKGLPTPAEIKAGAKVTLDMIGPAASAPSLPSLAAFGAGGVKEYRKRKRYVEAAVKAVAEGRASDPALDMLWAQVKGRRGLPSPEQIESGASITIDMVMPPPPGTKTTAMGYSFGDDLPEDDSDIDASLGADEEDLDDDMDDLGADDEDLDDMDEMGSSAIGTRNAYRRNVKDLFQALERNKSRSVAKNWDQVKRIWAKLTKAERREVKHVDDVLREAGKVNLQMMKLVTGKSAEKIKNSGKKKSDKPEAETEVEVEAEAVSGQFNRMGFDGLPDDDSDIDETLGADDDDDFDLDELGADESDDDLDLDELGADDDDLDDELDALGADDDLDDDLDDMLGGEDDDDDFGEDLEQSLDLEMQRALVNRYSGSRQAFPAGDAPPFPPPRMAGQEVF